jgi:hypothetical protein
MSSHLRRSILLIAGTVFFSSWLSGCSTSTLTQIQSSTKADQDAVLALGKAVGDKPLMMCAAAMDSIASVDCPVIPIGQAPAAGQQSQQQAVVGPACLAAKAYLVEQSLVGDCAALQANAKSGFLKILSGLGITP